MSPVPSSTRRRHVLLVDDNLVNQRVGTAMLEHLGFSADVVTDGAQAVRAATSSSSFYEAILMDCQMPVLDGYQATSEIRRLQGTSRRTPIIALTGSASAADQQRCRDAGMDDYLSKPLVVKTLAVILARWASATAASPDEERKDSSVSGPDASSCSALDAQVVARLERLGATAGQDLLGQLATLYLADAESRVVAMREGLAGDDAEVVSRSAHTLTGASANLGATELARLCSKLSTDAAAGDLVGGTALLEEVEAELGRVRSALAARATTS